MRSRENPAEEKEARLLQLRVRQQQQLAAETPEETGVRRQRDRENHMDPSSSHSHEQPFFNQPTVRSKMSKFHSGMAGSCSQSSAVADCKYYHTMDGTIDATALAKLPQDGSASHFLSVTEDWLPTGHSSHHG